MYCELHRKRQAGIGTIAGVLAFALMNHGQVGNVLWVEFGILAMTNAVQERLLNEISEWELVDPHTHINPHAPASNTLADILGYHYYTELAHSGGMSRDAIEEEGLEPRTKVQRLVENLQPLENTIQYDWLIEIAKTFFDFPHPTLTTDNWEELYDSAETKMAEPDWADQVLKMSRLSAVFLTNDFDDPLEGFDTTRYIPCLRTDDLVFHLSDPNVQQRLASATDIEANSASQMQEALQTLVNHFVEHGARACAISLPPDFAPTPVSDSRADLALSRIYSQGQDVSAEDQTAAAKFVFWSLAQQCQQASLPFDLMIGVNRGVYEQGVYQGRDLFDSRVSLIQYRELFNAFLDVTFPVSVLASVTNQELASYAWIFPNVVTHGHWWYSNTPPFIEFDLASRLEAVPQTKQIGYYSDMYKLEFALPKFDMYRRLLAKVLTERFIVDRGWSEERAIQLAKRVLRDNVESVFGV